MFLKAFIICIIVIVYDVRARVWGGAEHNSM